MGGRAKIRRGDVMGETTKRLRGLKDLIRDGIEHGSAAIEKVHLETANRPFAVLEHVPPISIPSKGVHAIHDATARTVYQIIRIVGHAVTESLDVALDVLEKAEAEAEAQAAAEQPPATDVPPEDAPVATEASVENAPEEADSLGHPSGEGP